jgi:hypothetical protein
VACGAASAPPPSIPADALHGLDLGTTAGTTKVLTVADLAEDALVPGGLTRILEDVGYLSGAERAFTGGRDIRSVTVRVLRFASPSGARDYLAWLDGHAQEVLGAIDVSATIEVHGSQVPVYGHMPGGCCPKEIPMYLTAWSDGARVVTVLVLGPAADRGAVASVVQELDRAIGGSESDA